MQPISSPRFTLTEQYWPWRQRLPHLQLVSSRFNHASLTEQDLADYRFALPPSLANAAHKRRAEFMAGRLCARRALWLVQGKECVPSIGQDRAPMWPQGAVGAISHSDSWAAAVVAAQADYLGIGLDIERCLSNGEAKKLMAAIFTAAERERLALFKPEQLEPEQLGFMVTLTFSLKESLFKALYPLLGKRFYFEDAELVDWDSVGGTARLRLVNSLSPDWPTGSELDAHFCQYDDHLWCLVAIPAG